MMSSGLLTASKNRVVPIPAEPDKYPTNTHSYTRASHLSSTATGPTALTRTHTPSNNAVFAEDFQQS